MDACHSLAPIVIIQILGKFGQILDPVLKCHAKVVNKFQCSPNTISKFPFILS